MVNDRWEMHVAIQLTARKLVHQAFMLLAIMEIASDNDWVIFFRVRRVWRLSC